MSFRIVEAQWFIDFILSPVSGVKKQFLFSLKGRSIPVLSQRTFGDGFSHQQTFPKVGLQCR
jgi:hypothetical protein